MKLGMNMNLWSTSIGEEHYPLFTELKKTGFDGVEIVAWEGSIDHFQELRKELANQGLAASALTSCEPETNPISEDPAVRAAAVQHLRESVARAHALGAKTLVGPFHSAYAEFVGRGPTDDERKWCAEVLRPVAEEAGAAGITLALEFLNRFECYFLTTAEDARALVRSVDHPACTILYDTHHAHIEEKDTAASIRMCKDEIGHVHISENDRGTPGTGQVDWKGVFDSLKAIDYDGWLMIEAFSRLKPEFAAAIRVWRDFFSSPEEVYRDGLAFMKKMWAQA